MNGLLIWWFQACCECVWFDLGEPCWQPCGLHEHMHQARWC